MLFDGDSLIVNFKHDTEYLFPSIYNKVNKIVKKRVIDHSLERSSEVCKSWVVGEMYSSFSTDWLLSTYDLFPAPNDRRFIAQLVRASQHYCEVTGSNLVEVLNFTGFYIRNCITCVHNWEDHSLLDFKSTVQYMKYFIYNFTFIPHRLPSTHKWPAPKVTGFIAQLLRASHWYR